jgi:hypothetical protein
MLQDIRQLKDTSVLLHTLAGFWLLTLVLIGVCGSIIKIISPDGLIAQTLGQSASVGAAAIAAMLFVGAAGWFAHEWASPGEKNRIVDMVLYAFAGAGFLFVLRLATGSGF